ncbi:hypothetical protein BKA81DRAFT_59285 [Phyllosticta paracitricarpa]|uniref:Uncharacterized protein n=1 Tax=Phyllosticta paracitricarpa TaxID=2016321 RepID=A0ABR1NFD1_9PEZI
MRAGGVVGRRTRSMSGAIDPLNSLNQPKDLEMVGGRAFRMHTCTNAGSNDAPHAVCDVVLFGLPQPGLLWLHTLHASIWCVHACMHECVLAYAHTTALTGGSGPVEAVGTAPAGELEAAAREASNQPSERASIHLAPQWLAKSKKGSVACKDVKPGSSVSERVSDLWVPGSACNLYDFLEHLPVDGRAGAGGKRGRLVSGGASRGSC